MARSRNDLIRRRIGKAILRGNLTSTGRAAASSPATLYSYDSSGALLTQVDSASLADGSLHYLSKLRQMYVWDDSDGQFFQLSSLSGDSALGSTYVAPVTYTYQGNASGYAAGGQTRVNLSTVNLNSIERYSFTSDGNGTDVADLLNTIYEVRGHSSTTNGYASGGRGLPGAAPYSNQIQKFVFATEANTTDIADLTVARSRYASISSADHGYSAGGRDAVPAGVDVIDRFPFTAEDNATDVGDLTQGYQSHGGASGPETGYSLGGATPPSVNNIEKFSYAATANATDVGDLTQAKTDVTGQNSDTHGYSSGGTQPTTQLNVIEKFSFSTDANATDVGDLTTIRRQSAPGSSTTDGYTHGGAGSPPAPVNVIDKFPFATDANATDVGDTHTTRALSAGFQV